jgi:chaperonin cofactor prefoldin
LKRRSKIVSFRLSDEEYDSLKNVSASRGARSVSEFTRSVACGKLDGNGDKLEETLRTLNERMELIDTRLQVLTEALIKTPTENTE